jgi:hypothetical protein
LSTYHDDRENKLNSEKLIIEKQLVEYKFKYAETAARLNDLEGEFEKMRNKCKVYSIYIILRIEFSRQIENER